MSTIQRKRNTQNVVGSRPSLHNGQLIVSTGNPSLDALFGGGLPISSLVLIEEDKYQAYFKILARYFLAEGAVYKNDLFVAYLDDDPKRFIKKIPQPLMEKGSSTLASSSSSQGSASGNSSTQSKIQMEINEFGSNEDMRIAWRYNGLPKVDAEHIDHQFDLSIFITAEMIEQLNIILFDGHCSKNKKSQLTTTNIFKNQIYYRLLQQIKNKIQTTPINQLLRICILSLGSPKWYDTNCSQDLCLFLTLLKSLVRSSSTICYFTMPMYILKHLDDRLIPRIRNLMDYSIELEAFCDLDKEINPIFKEYHGLVYIHRISALNTLAPSSPETHDLAFKFKKKHLIIEKLHLPPELQEKVSDGVIEASTAGCGGSIGGIKKPLLDF